MEHLLSTFYAKATVDHRIGATHVSLYLALLHESATGEWLMLDRVVVMAKAKICSRVTYHRCLKALHAYGYIEYIPSFNPRESKVRMIDLL